MVRRAESEDACRSHGGLHPAIFQPVILKGQTDETELDHTQRLNLHALLGAQRADVELFARSGRSRTSIALDADEEKAVELKREMVAGQERVIWNADVSLPARDSSSTIPRPHTSGCDPE